MLTQLHLTESSYLSKKRRQERQDTLWRTQKIWKINGFLSLQAGAAEYIHSIRINTCVLSLEYRSCAASWVRICYSLQLSIETLNRNQIHFEDKEYEFYESLSMVAVPQNTSAKSVLSQPKYP